MKIEGNKITAEEGKVFKRKSDGFIYGNEIYLGYTYFIGGKELDEPYLEVPEDFDEVEEKKEN
jgi:hypothetical protein